MKVWNDYRVTIPAKLRKHSPFAVPAISRVFFSAIILSVHEAD